MANRRIESVDLLRGCVMVLMALDHTRDYFGVAGNPTAIATTTVPLFFTRWITHFCAPTFFLLTGVGARLARAKTSTGALSRYLILRGALLIALEVTVMRLFAYQFNADYHMTGLVVLWALGAAMIFLGAIVFLPTWVIATIGTVMILGHNAFDAVRSTNPLWLILHQPGIVFQSGNHAVFEAYPLVPWIGVTAVGYALGAIYQWEPQRRRRLLMILGATGIVAFVALRALNVYGDPVPWSAQPTSVKTLLSFLNANKYPPSLLFLLMTLGPAMLFLRWADGRAVRGLAPALTYGRTPLFYFMVHFALIHVIAVVFCLVRYGAAHWMFESPSLADYPYTRPPGWGYSLPVVYAVWISVVIALYPACRWFAAQKAARGHGWMSYF